MDGGGRVTALRTGRTAAAAARHMDVAGSARRTPARHATRRYLSRQLDMAIGPRNKVQGDALSGIVADLIGFYDGC